jgi:hypothetical protein
MEGEEAAGPALLDGSAYVSGLRILISDKGAVTSLKLKTQCE